jgi:hypothetical protein
MKMKIIFAVLTGLMILSNAHAVVVTADDFWDSAVAAGTVSGTPAESTRYDIGGNVAVGDLTFSAYSNDTVSPSVLSFYATSTTAGIGVNEDHGSSNARNNMYNNQRVEMSFTSEVELEEIVIGRWGPSDGSFEISGFSADPAATAVNYNYSDVDMGAVTTSYDDATGILEIQAVSAFGYVRVSFPGSVKLSQIGLNQAASGNDGMCFHSISYIQSNVPSITAQPVNQIVDLDALAVFAVEATGELPITYAWYKTDQEIPDPISDQLVQSGPSNSLTIAAPDLSDEAFYYCVVSNNEGTVMSQPAVLCVKRMQAHWQLDQVEYDTSGLYPDLSTEDQEIQNAIPDGIPTFVDGVEPSRTNQGVMMDINGAATAGTWDPSKYSNQFTATCWVNLNNTGTVQPIFCKRDTLTDAGDRWFVQVDGNSILTLEAFGQTALTAGHVENGKWTMVTVAFDGTVGRLYIDGILMAEDAFALPNGKDSMIRIGHWDGDVLEGVVDDIRIYNHALTIESIIQLHYETSGRGVCDLANTVPYDLAGPQGLQPDCKVDIYDLLVFITEWMQ